MMARSGVQLIIRQQPERAQIVQESNPRNRKPIDPPPIVQLKYEQTRNDKTNGQWLVSPRTFMTVTLIDSAKEDETQPARYLIGQTVSSLHRLKDNDNKDGGFFVFGDISAKKLGTFSLRFSLFDSTGRDAEKNREPEEVVFMGHVDSKPFQVLQQRDFGSMSESTQLTRTFSDQGVKLRVRKDNRAVSRSIGNKRPFDASSAVSSSPHHASLYGGPVQDHQYSATTPEAKRQRADSDYGHQNLYSSFSMPENAYTTYSNTLPSSTRQWAVDEHQGRNQTYSQHSPPSLPVMGRMQTMNISNGTNWQSLPHNSALPSPSPSVSTQTPTYPGVSTQTHSASMFGDPGSNPSIPRNYYGYQYSTPTQYETAHPGDAHSAYSDLQLPVTTPGPTALGSTHTHGYGNGYIQGNALFDTDASEGTGTYAYMDPTQDKY